jgi:hypothetical protein
LQVVCVILPPLRCRAFSIPLKAPKGRKACPTCRKLRRLEPPICDDFRRGVCRRQSCRFRHIPHDISLPMTRPSKPNLSIQSTQQPTSPSRTRPPNAQPQRRQQEHRRHRIEHLDLVATSTLSRKFNRARPSGATGTNTRPY